MFLSIRKKKDEKRQKYPVKVSDMPCECKHCKSEQEKTGTYISQCKYENRRNTRIVMMEEGTTGNNSGDGHGDDSGDGYESPLR